jgi:hypothetical protein
MRRDGAAPDQAEVTWTMIGAPLSTPEESMSRAPKLYSVADVIAGVVLS